MPISGPGYDSFVDEKAEKYTASVIDFEDRAAKRQRKEARKKNQPHISPQAGRMLAILTRAVGAERALEVGTNIGYSGGFLARALPDDGELVTVEIEADFAEEARGYFDEIGVGDRVTVEVGDAAEVLPDLDGPFQVAFIDADKANYPLYLEQALGLVEPGGVICADNMFWQGQAFRWIGDTDTKKIVDFAGQIGRDDRLLSTILPLGDGLSVSLVIKG